MRIPTESRGCEMEVRELSVPGSNMVPSSAAARFHVMTRSALPPHGVRPLRQRIEALRDARDPFNKPDSPRKGVRNGLPKFVPRLLSQSACQRCVLASTSRCETGTVHYLGDTLSREKTAITGVLMREINTCGKTVSEAPRVLREGIAASAPH